MNYGANYGASILIFGIQTDIIRKNATDGMMHAKQRPVNSRSGAYLFTGRVMVKVAP